MKKKLLIMTIFATITFNAVAQNIWYDTTNSIDIMNFSTSCDGCSISTVANPDATDALTVPTVLKFSLAANSNPEHLELDFAFTEGISLADVQTIVTDIRFYFTNHADILSFDSKRRLRLYLADIDDNKAYIQLQPSSSDEGEWEVLSYDYTNHGGTDLSNVFIKGTLRLIYTASSFTNNSNGLDFYIDTVTSNKIPNTPVLSINDIEKEDSTLRLVSNPVVNILEVSKQVTSASVYNSTGQKLKTFVANTKFDVSNLSTGLYLFSAQLENGKSQTLRFIKK